MRQFFLLFIAAFLTACSSNKEPDSIPGPPLGKAILVAPVQNEICTQGTVVSITESTIMLQWNAAANANGYELVIKNLEAGTTITKATTATQLPVTLKRNTPYSWYVKSISLNNTTTMQSDAWKFYNSGPAAVNYAPFPADLTEPTMGQSVNAVGGKITLAWQGSDVDNDIENYDVYLSELATPSLLSSAVTANRLNNVAVVSGKQYYWKVVSKDKKGNKSESAVYNFRVN